MLWFRRIIAIVFTILLLGILNLAIFTERSIDAAASKEIYIEILRRANVYTFIQIDLPKAMLSDIKNLNRESDIQAIMEKVGISDQEILNTLTRLGSHLHIQEGVEKSIEDIINFLTMETDSLEIFIYNPESLALEISKETKTLIRNSDVRNVVLEELIAPNIETINNTDLPLNITITNEEMMEIVEHVITQKWLHDELGKSLDAITPYLFGTGDNFSISVRLDDRVDIFSEKLKTILKNNDIYKPILNQISASIGPILTENQNNIPDEIRFSENDAKTLLSHSLSEQWVEKTIDQILDQITDYLVGRSESFNINVHIFPIKQDLLFNLEESISKRTHLYLENLPQCQEDISTGTSYTSTIKLPKCLTKNPVFKSRLEPEIDRRVEAIIRPIITTVSYSIPDQISLAETDLRLLDSSDLIHQTRNFIINGWTFTDKDLQKFIYARSDGKIHDQLLSIRSLIKHNSTFTDQDIYDENGLIKASEKNIYSNVENIRRLVSTIKTLKILVFFPVIIFAILIGFLGGRTWASRASWALLTLTVSAAITWIIWTHILPPYINETLGKSLNDEIIKVSQADLQSFPTTRGILYDRINILTYLTIDSLSNKIASHAFYLFCLSSLLSVVLGITHTYFGHSNIILKKYVKGMMSKQSD